MKLVKYSRSPGLCRLQYIPPPKAKQGLDLTEIPVDEYLGVRTQCCGSGSGAFVTMDPGSQISDPKLIFSVAKFLGKKYYNS
jgi:hypothetical protein